MKKFPNRVKEKQASRDEDERRLRDGEISPNELRRENGFASSLDISKFKITHIGTKKLKDIK